MASPHLGYSGRSSHFICCHQLFATEDILWHFQVWGCHDDVGFSSLCYLASDRSLTDLWLSVSQGCLHHDVYVQLESSLFIQGLTPLDCRQWHWSSSWVELDVMLVCI